VLRRQRPQRHARLAFAYRRRQQRHPDSAAISPRAAAPCAACPFDIVRGQVWPAPNTDRVLPTAVIIERMVAGAEALLSNATSRFRLQADPGA
jgi:hypothetical protein